ncbi:MAG: TIGR02300 family protein [Lentilitoribacter sp.]
MAKAELGTKRVCPETERKFYDLNRDPIISPYTGQSYPLTFFEKPEDEPVEEVKKEEEETTEAVVEPTTPELDEDGDVEIVSLEDADDETAGVKDIPDLDDDDDDIGSPSDDNTFLETDDDENDDLSDIVVVSDDGDES